MKENKSKNLLFQISHFLKKGKRKAAKKIESLDAWASREPKNGFPHLKIAVIYQQLGRKEDALAEYLKAAKLFCDVEQYHKGAPIYNQVLRQDPESESVKIRLAGTYKNIGFLEQAFILYHKLYCSYKGAGEEEKALEMIGFMADLDPQKFTLDERAHSGSQRFEKGKGEEGNDSLKEINLNQPLEGDRSFFDLEAPLGTDNSVEFGKAKSITMEDSLGGENIFTELKETKDLERLFLNYNYQMGLVCREMGLIDEAIKQLQMALKMGQEPIKTAKLLEICLRDKERLEECKTFTGPLQKEGAMAQ